MSIGDLNELIVCTECKTRVEYHEWRDGYMSCECWIRSTVDDPTPEKWVEIKDRKVNLCGGCRADIPERSVFRCADCGLPFHQTCLDQHCKHGNQKQELRSNNLFLTQQLAVKDAQLCSVGAGAQDLLTTWNKRNSKVTDHDWRLMMYEAEDKLTAALSSSAPCRHEELLDAIAEKADNLLYAATLPVSPRIHVEGLKGGMEEIKNMAALHRKESP